MPNGIGYHCKVRVKEMMMNGINSFAEIANELGISRRSVIRIAAQWDIYRTPDEIRSIMSKSRKELLRKERRRALFGFEQKTRIKLYSNKERKSLRYLLKRKGYVVLPKNNIIYFSEALVRKPEYESKGLKLGLRFMPIEALSTST